MKAKEIQKILWHIRWIIGLVGIINCLYFLFNYTIYEFEVFVGISILLLFFQFILNQMEKYYECIGSCSIRYGKEEKK